MMMDQPSQKSTLTLSSILVISPYSVRLWENADRNNSEYEQFLSNDSLLESVKKYIFL